MRKRIVIAGSSFAGYTAALKLKEHLGDQHDIVVFSASDEFLFMPSLIWVPFGLREKEQISFKLAPIYKNRGVDFRHSAINAINLEQRQISSAEGLTEYDYLLIATGPELNYGAVPGLGPRGGHTQSIFSWNDAQLAREAYERWLDAPGPVVIGAVQGVSCFGAAYEFLFNFAHQLRRKRLHKKVELTYMTAEPFLAHFGIGGFGNGTAMTEFFFKHLGIQAELNTSVREITADTIHLDDGRSLPFTYAMLAPSFRGVAPVRELAEITDKNGFVLVDENYRTGKYPEVYAAGVAVAMAPPQKTAVACGVPKTGYLSEEMAKIAVHNIIADMHGTPMVALPPAAIDAKCVLDAGNNGIIMTADHFLEPRKRAWLIPGPEAHWAKLAFEKYFMATRRRAKV